MSISPTNGQSRSNLPSVVTISIQLGVAQVEPACAEILVLRLQHEEVVFVPQGPRVCRRRETRNAFQLMADDRLIAPAGCVPRIVAALKHNGCDVRVHDFRSLHGESFDIDQKHVPEAEKEFPGLASTINTTRGGVIEASRGGERGRLVGHIARLLPAPRIFVACSTRESAAKMAASLGPFVGGVVEDVHGWNWRSPCRIVCGTFASLDRSQASDWPILVFEDAAEALGKATHEAIGEYGTSRVFALADSRWARSPKEELFLEILAGPVIYQAPKVRRELPRMSVSLATYSSPAERWPDNSKARRQQLWNSDRRNRAIAEVACAAAERDKSTLWRFGLLSGEPGDMKLPETPNVVVFVESVEHAKRLEKLLPGWQLLHGGVNAPAELRSLVKSAETFGLPPSCIATAVAASRCRRIDADVVIMAAGGNWPQLPASLAKRRSPVWIVDLADDSDQSLADDTNKRLRVYGDLGCRVEGNVPSSIFTSHQDQSPRRSSQRRKPNTSRRPRRPQRR